MQISRKRERVETGVRESDFEITFKTSSGSNANKNISTSQEAFAPLLDKNHLQFICFVQVHMYFYANLPTENTWRS